MLLYMILTKVVRNHSKNFSCSEKLGILPLCLYHSIYILHGLVWADCYFEPNGKTCKNLPSTFLFEICWNQQSLGFSLWGDGRQHIERDNQSQSVVIFTFLISVLFILSWDLSHKHTHKLWCCLSRKGTPFMGARLYNIKYRIKIKNALTRRNVLLLVAREIRDADGHLKVFRQ